MKEANLHSIEKLRMYKCEIKITIDTAGWFLACWPWKSSFWAVTCKWHKWTNSQGRLMADRLSQWETICVDSLYTTKTWPFSWHSKGNNRAQTISFGFQGSRMEFWRSSIIERILKSFRMLLVDFVKKFKSITQTSCCPPQPHTSQLLRSPTHSYQLLWEQRKVQLPF